MKRNNIFLILSFTLLLMLLLMVGAIGVKQINVLSDRISDLSLRQVPLQENVLSMKNHAQLYSSAVRNYVSWRIGKYFGAAQLVADVNEIKSISRKTFNIIKEYPYLARKHSSIETAPSIMGEQLGMLFKRINETEKRIVSLVDASVRAGTEKENSSKISALLVSFENQTFQFSQFIEKKIEPMIFQDLQMQLEQTQKEKSHRVLMLLLSLLFVFLLGLFNVVFVMKRLIKAQKHSELLVNHMISTEEREKRNLSFAMHNQMGQDLSALKIYLGILENKYGDSEEIGNGKKIVERLLERMHNIAELLCPPGLEDFGLVAMLKNMVEHYSSVMSAQIITDFDLNVKEISPENSLTLYRVVQEALTNVLKHAQASKVVIKLYNNKKDIFLEIADDGLGFELKKADVDILDSDGAGTHLGLLLLRERLTMLNASMQIITAPEQGTRINVTMPI